MVDDRLHPLRVASLGEERGGDTGQAHSRTVVPVSTAVRTRGSRFWTSDQTRNPTRDRMAGLRVLPRHFGVAQGGACSSYQTIRGTAPRFGTGTPGYSAHGRPQPAQRTL